MNNSAKEKQIKTSGKGAKECDPKVGHTAHSLPPPFLAVAMVKTSPPACIHSGTTTHYLPALYRILWAALKCRPLWNRK
jgi:hypothetical protein